MALSKIQDPIYITPVYNPINFTLSASTTSEENFRYICYLTDCNDNLLTTITQPPRPDNVLGFFNVQKLCAAYVTPLTPSKLFTQLYKTPEQACFKAKFAESYTIYYTCTSVNIDVSPVDGYDLQFYFNDDHGFNVGDIISFSGTGAIGDLYNNTWQVIATPSNTTINVNGLNQGTTNSGTTATCVLASHQRTTLSAQTNMEYEFWVNNSALGTCDFLDYKLIDYDISNNAEWPINWYNNIPQPFTLRYGNYLDAVVLYSQSAYPSNTPLNIIVRTYDNTGGTYTYTSPNIPDASWSGASTFVIPCGPSNLNNANVTSTWTPTGAATFPIIKTNTTSYDVRLKNGFAFPTNNLEFTIDNTCSKYTNFELNFLDTYGNYIPINFTLVQRKNVSVQRNTFKKSLGQVTTASGGFYECDDRGLTILNNIIQYTYTLQTNWMSEDMSLYYEQLITSPNVFWNYEGTGSFLPVVLTTNSVDVLDKKNSRLIQYSLTMTPSNNPIVQQGS